MITQSRASRRFTSSGEYTSVCIAHLRSDSPRDGQQNPTASTEQYSISKRPHTGCLMYKQHTGAFLHLRQKIEDPLMMHSASSFCSSTSRSELVSVIIPVQLNNFSSTHTCRPTAYIELTQHAPTLDPSLPTPQVVVLFGRLRSCSAKYRSKNYTWIVHLESDQRVGFVHSLPKQASDASIQQIRLR